MAASLTPSLPASGPARLRYLDSLRVLATLIVFMFHALHPFDMLDWHIKNDERSIALTVVMFVLSTWGMPFFFVLAGAGTWLALKRRSPGEFLRERTSRLLVPFICGSLLLTPVMKYFEWAHLTATGQNPGTYLGSLADMAPFLSPATFGHTGYHLWFLGFLFAFSAVCLPLFIWLKGDRGQTVVAWLARLADLRGGLLLYILPVLLTLAFLRPYFPDEHDWSDFFFRMNFFILGYLFLADERFGRAVRRDWLLLAGTAAVSFLGMLAMFATGVLAPLLEGPMQPLTYLLGFLVAASAVAWSLTMVNVGMAFMDRRSRVVDYGQEAVLPFYALHQPVIIVVAFYVVQWQLPVLLKVILVVGGSFAATLSLYHFVVRRVPLLRTIFGMTAPPKARAVGTSPA